MASIIVPAITLVAAHVRTLAREQFFPVLIARMKDIDKKLSELVNQQAAKDEKIARGLMEKPTKEFIKKMKDVKKKYPFCSMSVERDDLRLFWKRGKIRVDLTNRIEMAMNGSLKEYGQNHWNQTYDQIAKFGQSKNPAIKKLALQAQDIADKATSLQKLYNIKNDEILSCLANRQQLEDVAGSVQLVLKRYASLLCILPK